MRELFKPFVAPEILLISDNSAKVHDSHKELSSIVKSCVKVSSSEDTSDFQARSRLLRLFAWQEVSNRASKELYASTDGNAFRINEISRPLFELIDALPFDLDALSSTDPSARRMNDERDRRTTSFDWGSFVITQLTNDWRPHTAGVSTTLAVEVAFKMPALCQCYVGNRRKGEITVGFSVFRPSVEDAKVASQNTTPMAVCRLAPSCSDGLRNTLKQDVKESDGINSNLRENMGLCRSGKQEE